MLSEYQVFKVIVSEDELDELLKVKEWLEVRNNKRGKTEVKVDISDAILWAMVKGLKQFKDSRSYVEVISYQRKQEEEKERLKKKNGNDTSMATR